MRVQKTKGCECRMLVMCHLCETPVTAARRRFDPLRISPKSLSTSNSLLAVSCWIAFPSPVSACGCTPPPLFRFLCPPLVAYPFGKEDEVNGRGNGEGSSSTESEFGFGTGTTVVGSGGGPWPCENENAGGGGEVPPILLRNLRVMWGRDCESNAASAYP